VPVVKCPCVRYRFTKFLVDTGTRQLFGDGRERHLSPKAFELLLILLQDRARALSKAELQERLWPSTFVGETNLATLVAEIRRTLEDSAQDSRYLRTVHRFGYRFVADTVEMPPSAAAAEGEARMYMTLGDRRFPLAAGTFVIGRAPDAAIQIDSGGVSRLHARILVSGREARIEDLGSKNGTFVDGRPVSAPRILNDGAEVRVGPIALMFRVAPPVGATETVI
jgi:DNA-binding winged helix-turn-helix (wHTH) protein